MNCQKYGRLYNWDAAKSACPAGWHLPSNGEFEALIEAAGSKYVAGMKLKSTSGWKENGNGDDAFGYSALPAGNRLDNGFYRNEGYYASFWSSSEDDSYLAYYMGLYYGSDNADPNYDSKNDGFSVRCLKDSQ